MKLKVGTIALAIAAAIILGSDRALTVPSESVDLLAQKTTISDSFEMLEALLDLQQEEIVVNGRRHQIEVVVATYIPRNFQFEQGIIQRSESQLSYILVYQNYDSGACFYLKKVAIGGDTFTGLAGADSIRLDSPVIRSMAYLDVYESSSVSASSSISLEKGGDIEFESPCTDSDRAIETSEAVEFLESLKNLADFRILPGYILDEGVQ